MSFDAVLHIARARIRVKIAGVDTASAQQLTEKYAAFTVPDEGACHYTLLCSRGDTAYTTTEARIERLTPTRVKLYGPGLEGELDESSGLAETRYFTQSIRPIDNALRLLVSEHLRANDGALFHAAGLVEAGRGYLFPGASEAGKTTLARRAGFAHAMSDELTAVLPNDDGTFRIAATPFWGDMGHGDLSGDTPLRAIAILEGKGKKSCRTLPHAEALQKLLACAFCYSHDESAAEQLARTCEALADVTPVLAIASEREEPFESVVERVERGIG